MRYTVKPHNVCAASLSFDLDGDVVRNVEFTRGCDGNLKAISKLVDGRSTIRCMAIHAVLRIHPAQTSWPRLCANVTMRAGNRLKGLSSSCLPGAEIPAFPW